MSTSRGNTSLNAGINKTSSKVSPSPKNRDLLLLLVGALRFVAIGKDTFTNNMAKFGFTCS
jgi:hypothetical protein